MPSHIQSEQDLKHLFQPLLDHIEQERLKRESEDNNTPLVEQKTAEAVYKEEEQFKQVGAKIKTQWNETEVAGSGWKPG